MDIQHQLDALKNVSPTGIEYWWGRDLIALLDYDRWENFSQAIQRARTSCSNMKIDVHRHFRDVTKNTPLGRPAADVALSRFGAYLVSMNADPSKTAVAECQEYFLVQTRIQEIQQEALDLEKRKALRDRVKVSVKKLGDAAMSAGVTNYGRFHNEGYLGLYGMSLKQLKDLKGLPANEELLDCIGRAELAANEFKNTQTELKLRNEDVQGENLACETHREVGRQVRKFMSEQGQTAPENLPIEPSLKRRRPKALDRQTRNE
jgi:DNA-damage-inducible protein D